MKMTEYQSIVDQLKELINSVGLEQRVDILNDVRAQLHDVSPFKHEPVDLVQWVKNTEVVANDYNPNKVAPPEMQLLEVSIMEDGYTQPIVTWAKEDINEVVDGFHRSRVGKESKVVNKRVNGYLPIVGIRKEKSGKKERIASTIRHNRARGKHQISAMSEIVIELKNRNWTNKRIARELGMDQDEILRLCQISGLEDLFSDKDFSKAWVSADSADDFEPINDDVEDMDLIRIPNEKDENRIYHTYDKWEAVQYGFFELKHPRYSKTQCENLYKELLSDLVAFEDALKAVTTEWVYSCEHNLTNSSMNRIAWLGQAALAYVHNIPSIYCAGFKLLTKEQQDAANEKALEYLNKWLVENGREPVSIEQALLINRQVELY